MHITEAAAKVHPGTAWNLRGDKLEQANDGTPRVDVPSNDELQPLMDAVAYREERAAEYPSVGDQLDALWKGGDAAAAMLAQVQAIKAKYPKP